MTSVVTQTPPSAPESASGRPSPLGVVAIAIVVLAIAFGIYVGIAHPHTEFEVGVQSFATPPFFESVPWFDRVMLLGFLGLVLGLVFWLLMARNQKLVPSKSQFTGEWAYSLVRDGIARDQIGQDFKKYLPYLIALFTFLLINNLWGMFPFTLIPTTSHIGWAYALAVMSWLVYNGVGIRKHGFFGYVRHSVLPSGVPWPMWFLVIPIEFLSNIVIRPITLSLRLFGNMFAGHLLVLVFAGGGEYLLFQTEPLINKLAGGAALVFSLVIFALETFVQVIQAYIFTILTAQYIGSSLAEDH